MAIDSVTGVSAAANAQPSSATNANSVARGAAAAVHALNRRDIPGRRFTVVREPESHRFVIQVVDDSTGDVIDQFPPEDIIKMLKQLDTESTGKE
jgi:hypothetical protein